MQLVFRGKVHIIKICHVNVDDTSVDSDACDYIYYLKLLPFLFHEMFHPVYQARCKSNLQQTFIETNQADCNSPVWHTFLQISCLSYGHIYTAQKRLASHSYGAADMWSVIIINRFTLCSGTQAQPGFFGHRVPFVRVAQAGNSFG